MSADKKQTDPFKSWLGFLFIICLIISYYIVSSCAPVDSYSDDPLYGASESECEVDPSDISLLDFAVKTGALMFFGVIAALSLQGYEREERSKYLIKLELELLDAKRKLSNHSNQDGKADQETLKSIMIPIPAQCHLWKLEHPSSEDLHALKMVKLLRDDSDYIVGLRRCSRCGQLYFSEFIEFIDYENGDDAQYWTYIPILREQDADELARIGSSALIEYFPQIRYAWPTGGKKEIQWLR